MFRYNLNFEVDSHKNELQIQYSCLIISCIYIPLIKLSIDITYYFRYVHFKFQLFAGVALKQGSYM